MVPKRFWLAAKATSKTPGFSVLSSPPDSKPDTVADIFKHNLNRNRRRWNIGFAVVASLVALILGLSLGLTVGRRHANNDGKLSSVVGGKLSSVVDLGYSRYQGIDLQNGVNQWLGIRYAAAPIGDLRFTAPQDPTPNSTVQKAAEHGPICLGSQQRIAHQPISLTYSEDCLFLDLYSPSNATKDSNLPVYVFIQGGGFNLNANANLNGTSLVKASGRNIIVITFNDRVSLYGFLASAEVQKGGSLNIGLLDQRKVLQWVQKYISRFGGDPNHVVMGGASAGGGSVALQVAAYGGRDDNVFHATAAESQSFGAIRTVSDSQYQYDQLVSRTKCTSKDTGHNDTLACLRGLSTDALQTQNIGTPFPGGHGDPLFPYNPVIDHDFLQDLTLALFESGRFHNVPAIYGDVSNEGTIFVPRTTDTVDESDSFLRSQFPTINSTQLSTIQTLFPTSQYPHIKSAGNHWQSTSAAYGELRYVCPGNYLGTQYYAHNSSSTVYNYHYNVTSPANSSNGLGVPHVAELIAIWDPPSLPPSYKVGGENANVIPLLQAYWTSFIRFYDPNVARLPGSPRWEVWGGQNSQQRIRFQGGSNAASDTVMEIVPSDQKHRCEKLIQMGISLKQ